MAWTLNRVECQTFARNSLAAVIVQLRFHPILKVADKLADFQERVRKRFPGYDAIETQNIDMGPQGVQVRNDTAHRFHAAGEPSIASLTTASFSLEYAAHDSRAILLHDLEIVLSALQAVYSPIAPVRLGVRYVNLIRQKPISEYLGRPVAWADLLTPHFSAVPGGIAGLDDGTNFLVEITAPCQRGKMTVKYGVLPEPALPLPFAVPAGFAVAQQFRLDTDRFIEGSFKPADITSLAAEFVEDIFQVFMTAAGPALLEWMERKP